MLPGAAEKLRDIYDHPDDIDLFAGGISEKHMSYRQVGPTFSCIIKQQFVSLRDGDRFYYENENVFTKAQLRAIKKVTMATIYCNNLKNIVSIQRDVFHAPDCKNTRVVCTSIPMLDLSPWKESAGMNNSKDSLTFRDDTDNVTEEDLQTHPNGLIKQLDSLEEKEKRKQLDSLEGKEKPKREHKKYHLNKKLLHDLVRMVLRQEDEEMRMEEYDKDTADENENVGKKEIASKKNHQSIKSDVDVGKDKKEAKDMSASGKSRRLDEKKDGKVTNGGHHPEEKDDAGVEEEVNKIEALIAKEKEDEEGKNQEEKNDLIDEISEEKDLKTKAFYQIVKDLQKEGGVDKATIAKFNKTVFQQM